MIQQQQDNVWRPLKLLADWVAAALGIGTLAGLVNVVVGVLSAVWLAYQLYVAIKYELPLKRLRLAAARSAAPDPAPTDKGALE